MATSVTDFMLPHDPTIRLVEENIVDILNKIGFRVRRKSQKGPGAHYWDFSLKLVSEVNRCFWEGLKAYRKEWVEGVLKQYPQIPLGLVLGRDRTRAGEGGTFDREFLATFLLRESSDSTREFAIHAGYVRVAKHFAQRLQKVSQSHKLDLGLETSLCLGQLFSAESFGKWLKAVLDREQSLIESVGCRVLDRVHSRPDIKEPWTIPDVNSLQRAVCQWGAPSLLTLWVLRNTVFQRIEDLLESKEDKNQRTDRGNLNNLVNKEEENEDTGWKEIAEKPRLCSIVEAFSGLGDHEVLKELSDGSSDASLILEQARKLAMDELPLSLSKLPGVHGDRWSPDFTWGDCRRAARELVSKLHEEENWIPTHVVAIHDPEHDGGLKVRKLVITALNDYYRKENKWPKPIADHIEVKIEGRDGKDREMTDDNLPNLPCDGSKVRLLVVDDTAITGGTLEAALRGIKQVYGEETFGRSVEVRFAVIAAGRTLLGRTAELGECGVHLSYHYRGKYVLGKDVQFPWDRVPATGDLREEAQEPMILNRPWGHMPILFIEDNQEAKHDKRPNSVRLIAIEPGHRLSYQAHAERDEEFVVLEGEITIRLIRPELVRPWLDRNELTLEDLEELADDLKKRELSDLEQKPFVAKPGDFIFVPRGVFHRFEVPLYAGAQALELAFSAKPYDQDDIVRLDDDYDRAELGDAPRNADEQRLANRADVCPHCGSTMRIVGVDREDPDSRVNVLYECESCQDHSHSFMDTDSFRSMIRRLRIPRHAEQERLSVEQSFNNGGYWGYGYRIYWKWCPEGANTDPSKGQWNLYCFDCHPKFDLQRDFPIVPTEEAWRQFEEWFCRNLQ